MVNKTDALAHKSVLPVLHISKARVTQKTLTLELICVISYSLFFLYNQPFLQDMADEMMRKEARGETRAKSWEISKNRKRHERRKEIRVSNNARGKRANKKEGLKRRRVLDVAKRMESKKLG